MVQLQRARAERTPLLKVLSSLQNPMRFRIVSSLMDDGEQTVSELHERISVLSQSALSQHLAVLRRAKLVSTRRVSQSIHYRLGDDRLVDLMQTFRSCYSDDSLFVPANTRRRLPRLPQ